MMMLITIKHNKLRSRSYFSNLKKNSKQRSSDEPACSRSATKIVHASRNSNAQFKCPLHCTTMPSHTWSIHRAKFALWRGKVRTFKSTFDLPDCMRKRDVYTSNRTEPANMADQKGNSPPPLLLCSTNDSITPGIFRPVPATASLFPTGTKI